MAIAAGHREPQRRTKTGPLEALGAAHLFTSSFLGYDLWLRNYRRLKIREKNDIFNFPFFSNSTLHSRRAGHSAQYHIFVSFLLLIVSSECSLSLFAKFEQFEHSLPPNWLAIDELRASFKTCTDGT